MALGVVPFQWLLKYERRAIGQFSWESCHHSGSIFRNLTGGYDGGPASVPKLHCPVDEREGHGLAPDAQLQNLLVHFEEVKLVDVTECLPSHVQVPNPLHTCSCQCDIHLLGLAPLFDFPIDLLLHQVKGARGQDWETLQEPCS